MVRLGWIIVSEYSVMFCLVSVVVCSRLKFLKMLFGKCVGVDRLVWVNQVF